MSHHIFAPYWSSARKMGISNELPHPSGAIKNATLKDLPLFATLGENDIAFANKASAHPILFNNDARHSIAIVLSDPETSNTGIVNASNVVTFKLPKALAEMASHIRKNNPGARLEAHIIGQEIPKYDSSKEWAQVETAVEASLNALGKLSNVEIKTLAVLGDNRDRSFGFDTRNGDMFYMHELNPALALELNKGIAAAELQNMPYEKARRIECFPVMYDGIQVSHQSNKPWTIRIDDASPEGPGKGHSRH